MEYSAGRPVSVPQSSRPVSTAVTFKSSAGVPILSREADRSSLVVGSDGEVISSLGALLNAGMVAEHNGSYVLAGDLAPAQAAPQQDQQQAPQVVQQSDPSSDPMAPEGPERDLMSPKTEAILNQLSTHHGDAYRVLEASVVAGNMPSAQEMDAAGVQMGLSRTEVSGLVHAAVAEFSNQAMQAVAGMVGDADAVFQWASSDKQGAKLFKEARAQQARDRSLAGYSALTQGYLLDLASKDPAAVASGLVAGGICPGGRRQGDARPGPWQWDHHASGCLQVGLGWLLEASEVASHERSAVERHPRSLAKAARP